MVSKLTAMNWVKVLVIDCTVQGCIDQGSGCWWWVQKPDDIERGMAREVVKPVIGEGVFRRNECRKEENSATKQHHLLLLLALTSTTMYSDILATFFHGMIKLID